MVCDDFRQEQVNAMIAAAGSGESTDRDLVGAVSKAIFFNQIMDMKKKSWSFFLLQLQFHKFWLL